MSNPQEELFDEDEADREGDPSVEADRDAVSILWWDPEDRKGERGITMSQGGGSVDLDIRTAHALANLLIEQMDNWSWLQANLLTCSWR